MLTLSEYSAKGLRSAGSRRPTCFFPAAKVENPPGAQLPQAFLGLGHRVGVPGSKVIALRSIADAM